MPRLDDGQLANSANKFKKRRAWLLADDVDTVNANEKNKSAYDATVILPASTVRIDNEIESVERLEQDQNKIETIIKHDLNKSQTRLKQESNKTKTRVEHSKPKYQAALNESDSRLKHESNKTETRLEHDLNMTTTRVTHDGNTGKTASLDSFFSFLVHHKERLTASDDEDRWLLLGLSDVQKRMFWHVAINCIERGAQRTGPMEIKSFFSPLGISIDVVRTSLTRITDKGLLQREKGKLGKNGFAIISLPRTIHDAAKDIFSEFRRSQLESA